MQWNVLYNNFNARKIEEINIFKYSSFTKDVENLLKEDISKDEFADKLRRKLQYRFWSKCEWEVVVTS